MKKMFKILLVFIGVLFLTGCDFLTIKNEHPEYLSGKHYAEMKIKKAGTVELELDADIAPITVTNFMNLVEEGYYDNLPIHRVAKDFVIQSGNGEEKNTIKGEFDANGVSNDISHVRGVISMARAGDQSTGFDTASTQFFIVLNDSTFLDHYYASFGKVTKGMDVIDKAIKSVKTTDENGTILREEEMPIIEYIKKIEK